MTKGRIAVASLTMALMAGVIQISAGAVTTNLVDSVEIAADTNIVVAANEVLKIEYVYGDNPVTVTKSGGGRLEIATSSITNLSVVVADGVFASTRPQALVDSIDFHPTIRIDANDTSKFTIAASGGTNFISRVNDADGGPRFLTNWGGSYHKPYVAEEKLNGMGLIDFGTYYGKDVPELAGGHGGNFGLNKVDGHDGFPLREYFYVWKDRDDIFDHPLIDGKEFTGPGVIGNNPGYFMRGKGGAGSGFELVSSGMNAAFKKNLCLDGQKVANSFKPSRGFHVFRNRAYDTDSPYLSMLGWNNGKWGGGFLLAELIACSNELTEATAKRVEAQLQSKWLGLKVASLKVNEGATLDVGACPFKIGTLDVQDGVTGAGLANLNFGTLTRASSSVVTTAAVELDGARQPLMPDLAFTGDAEISVSGTSRIQTVSSATDRLVKSGDGELLLADLAASNITVTAGTLSVSPLYARSAEYHLDATRTDTIVWTETDGKKQISTWYDIEDPSRAFKYPSWRTMRYVEPAHSLNKPYIAENAARGLTMVDFGTFLNGSHLDGWGGCLDASPSVSGLHDCFVAWMDDPDVKNYEGEFAGPCFFGMQYHWTRGKGGNGNSFAVHYTGCPINMWNPPEEKRVIVDGAVVHGQNYRVGDGVHVLAQRTTVNDGEQGAPVQEIGCNWQSDIYGGLKIGEVLMFKAYLTDRMRMRISGALCSKWRGDTNEWAYGAMSVASGATLNHPYADLVPESLDLAGKLSTVSVKPNLLRIEGSDAEVEGQLILSDGGCMDIGYDPVGGFTAMKASSVYAEGKGTIAITVPSPGAFVGREFRIVETTSATAAPGFLWKAPSLKGSGVRAVLRAKADGIYLVFEGNGFTLIVK